MLSQIAVFAELTMQNWVARCPKAPASSPWLPDQHLVARHRHTAALPSLLFAGNGDTTGTHHAQQYHRQPCQHTIPSAPHPTLYYFSSFINPFLHFFLPAIRRFLSNQPLQQPR